MDGSWTLGMNGFFSKSEDKNIPKGTCNFWQKFKQLEAFEDQRYGPAKGGRWFFFFLRLDLGSSFKISKHLAGKWWRFFQKSRGSWGIFFHFFPPILVVKDCGNATKHEFTLPSRFLRRGLGWVEFVQFGTFLTEKTVAQVLHHWICSLVPIDGGHVFCQSVG